MIKETAYDDYYNCFKQYIDWMKEQIEKDELGIIKVRRLELMDALNNRLFEIGYKKKIEKTLYNIMKIIFFDQGLYIYKDTYNNEKIFSLRNKCAEDKLAMAYKDYRRDLIRMTSKKVR